MSWVELKELEGVKKQIQELVEVDIRTYRELEKVRKETGKLFRNASRLARAVKQGWDRNIVLEMKLKRMNVLDEENHLYQQAIACIKQDIEDLRETTLATINEFRLDCQSAFQAAQCISTTFRVPHFNYPTNNSIYSTSFSESTDTSCFSNDDSISSEISIKRYPWEFSDEEAWQWYRTMISTDVAWMAMMTC